MRAAFCTLGCKVNQYDTEAMRELFERAGYESVEFDDMADVYLINTCTVTAMSDKKSRQMIARAHAKNPNARIVVTGCYSQRAPEEILKLPGVALVLGTKDRLRVVELLENLEGEAASDVSGLMEETEFEPLSAGHEGRTRAHLKIQEGCNRYCTYCIIPYARGPLRSRPVEGVREELIKLAKGGYKEVVLTGIHLMSYGLDIGKVSLVDAIAQADGIDGIRRIRLGSLEPQLLSDDFVEALRDNPKICRQFHLSMQSGSDGVLKRMNRRYTTSEYAECVEKLRAKMPDCAITTDVIAGFPGESEAEFEETLAFVKQIGFARIHVFPYSRREGTVAARMPDQIPKQLKLERTAQLIALGESLERDYLKAHIGTVQEVLFEEEHGGFIAGYTGTYMRVHAQGEDLAGRILDVNVKDIREEGKELFLVGDICERKDG